MKQIVIRQYQEIVDNAAKRIADLSVPPEGWLRTVRSALGMSGAQLARLLDVSRSQVAQAEKNELAGVITLKRLQKMENSSPSGINTTSQLEHETKCCTDDASR